jgi:hypothetical protein
VLDRWFEPSGATLVSDHDGVLCNDGSSASLDVCTSVVALQLAQHAPLCISFEARSPSGVAPFVVGLAFSDADGVWLAGQNLDIGAKAAPEWEPHRVCWRSFPPKAFTARIVLVPAPGDESHTGTIAFRAVSAEASDPWAASRGCAISADSAGASVWTDWPEQPLWPEVSPPTPGKPCALAPHELVLIRGEAESLQIGLRADAIVVAALVEPLSHPTHGPLDGEVALLGQHRVRVDVPSDASGRLGFTPDALPPLELPLALSGTDTRGIWVRVRASREAVPGEYVGAVRLKFQGGNEVRVPLSARVLVPTLPRRPALSTLFGLPPQHLARFHGVEADPSARELLVERYLAEFSRARVAAQDPTEESPPAAWLPGWAWAGGLVVELGAQGRALQVSAEPGRGAERVAYTTEPIAYRTEAAHTVSWRQRRASGAGAYVVRVQGRNEAGQVTSERRVERTASAAWANDEFALPPLALPPGTAGVALLFEATAGAVDFDDVKLRAADDGTNLVANGAFEADPLESEVAVDISAFERLAVAAVQSHAMPHLRLWLPGTPHGHAGGVIAGNAFGFSEGHPIYGQLVQRTSQAVLEELSASGWLPYLYLYPFDEPAEAMIPEVAMALRSLSELAPSVPRLLTHTPHASLVGAVDWWMGVLGEIDLETVKKRHAANERVGAYVSCCLEPGVPNLLVDRPPMQARALPLLTWSAGLDGLLYWSAVHWDSMFAGAPAQDPWTDPRTVLPDGQVVGNGDGRLLYPPKSPKPGGAPIVTQRWELLRESLEDVDRVALLESIQALPSGTRRGVPREIVDGLVWYSDDVVALHTWRREVAMLLDSRADELPAEPPLDPALPAPPSGEETGESGSPPTAGKPGASPASPRSPAVSGCRAVHPANGWLFALLLVGSSVMGRPRAWGQGGNRRRSQGERAKSG